MKKVTQFLFLCTLTFSVFAKEIEYEYREVDKFTGLTKYETKPVIFLKKMKPKKGDVYRHIGLSVAFNGQMNFLSFNYIFKLGSTIQTMGVGYQRTHMIVLLENGEKLALPSAHPSGRGSQRAYFSHTIINDFVVTTESAKILSENKITDLRIEGMYHNYDIPIPEDERDAIKELCQEFTENEIKNSDPQKSVASDGAIPGSSI